MRATTLLNRVFDLPGVRVTGVDLGEVDGTGQVVVDVALRARLLACPACSFTTSRRYDRRDVDSSWRHLDLGGRVCRLRMRRRRLRCPTHGVVTQKVPFARPGARFTADFEDLVVWLVTRSDKTTVATFARVAWRTVGAMCERVAADVIDPHRLEGLVDIGVDEISWPQVLDPGQRPRHVHDRVGRARQRRRDAGEVLRRLARRWSRAGRGGLDGPGPGLHQGRS